MPGDAFLGTAREDPDEVKTSELEANSDAFNDAFGVLVGTQQYDEIVLSSLYLAKVANDEAILTTTLESYAPELLFAARTDIEEDTPNQALLNAVADAFLALGNVVTENAGDPDTSVDTRQVLSEIRLLFLLANEKAVLEVDMVAVQAGPCDLTPTKATGVRGARFNDLSDGFRAFKTAIVELLPDTNVLNYIVNSLQRILRACEALVIAGGVPESVL